MAHKVGEKDEHVAGTASDETTTSTLSKQLPNTVELVRTERYLWSLFTASSEDFSASMAPSKESVAECLRYYRRLLNQSQWKRVTIGNKSFLENFTGYKLTLGRSSAGSERDAKLLPEINELYNILSILSILCRSIILSYNVLAKQQAAAAAAASILPSVSPPPPPSARLGDLLQHLPPGSKSDMANQLLEFLEYSNGIWKQKYLALFFLDNLVSPCPRSWSGARVVADESGEGERTAHDRPAPPAPPAAEKRSSLHRRHRQHHRHQDAMVRSFYRRYLLAASPVVPLMAYFQSISTDLPMSYTPDVTLTRLFPATAVGSDSKPSCN